MILLQTHEVTTTDFYGAGFMVLLGYAVQWGIQRQKTKGLEGVVEELKQSILELRETIQERILPRQEYENRHKDLQNRVERLEQNEFLRSRRFPRTQEGG